MLLRTLLLMVVARFRPRVDPHAIGRLRRRVWPNDIDLLGHVNNGVYLSLMDLGRIELGIRSGTWQDFGKRGWYPVAACETATFRRSLRLWQRYELETRIVGYDEKAMYVQQRFVSGGEIYVEATVRARWVKKSGGTVSTAELGEASGVDVTQYPVPEWMLRWAEDVALPPARASHSSDW